MTTMVFVFGTLKEGFPNSHVNKGKRMPGSFKTEQCYSLYLVGERYVPWMIDDAGPGKQVIGQVYEVDAQQLTDMDVLERVGQADGYRRELIRVVDADDVTPTPMTVFAYVKPGEQLANQQLQSESLVEYTFEHAALYTQRASRLAQE